MRLLILRHADAVDSAPTDSDRQLSSKGVNQSEKVSAFCMDNGLIPECIFTSPVKRAKQTATIVQSGWNSKACEIIVEPSLACGATPEAIHRLLDSCRQFDSVMLVGHEPDLSTFSACILGTQSSGAIHIRKASLTVFDVTAKNATLEFSIPVKFM